MRGKDFHSRPRPRPGIRRTVQAGLLILLLLAAARLWQLAFLDQLAFNRGASHSFFLRQQTDPVMLTDLATMEYLNHNDVEGARTLYRKALAAQTLHLPAWIGLAQLEADQGNRSQATGMSNYIDQVAPATSRWRWDRAILADSLEQEELLRRNLSWTVANDRAKRREALYLAIIHWPEPEQLLEKLGPENGPSLLAHFIEKKDPIGSGVIWEQLLETQPIDGPLALRYVNFLIAGKEVAEAAAIWSREFKKDAGLLNNPDFSQPFIRSPFDWSMARAKGMEWTSQPQGGRLDVDFSGTENLVFRLQQLVPVMPGSTYLFSGEMLTRQLSTNERPHWRVMGSGCRGLDVRTEMAGENQSWTPFQLTFTAPSDCQAVWLGLYRNKSHFFDNKLSGSLSVRHLHLSELPVPESAIQ